jgi:hypothetical protein
MAKATTKLNAPDRVILFSAGIEHGAVGILARAMQSMRLAGCPERIQGRPARSPGLWSDAIDSPGRHTQGKRCSGGCQAEVMALKSRQGGTLAASRSRPTGGK